MQKKKSKPVVREEYLTIKIEDFNIMVETSINSEARRRRPESDSVNLFRDGPFIEITGDCTSPADRANERYRIAIFKNANGVIDFDAKIRDVHVIDKDGLPKYRKAGGRLLPVYDIPEGFAVISRKRGPVNWDGGLWMPNETITQLLIVLTRMQHPLYLRIHERKIDRTHWLDGLSLHTSDPTDE